MSSRRRRASVKRVEACGRVQVPVDRTPRVSDDPAQIAEVRKLHEQKEDAVFERAFEELRGRGIVLGRYRQSLERRKDRATSELKRIMNEDAAATDEHRAHAAHGLMTLGDRTGEDFLLAAVRDGQGPRRITALRMLDDWDSETKVDWGDPGRARLILDCLDDPDPEVVQEVASLCCRRRIPGAEARLVRLLEDGRAKDPRQLTREFAEVAESPEAVRVILDYLFRDRPKGHDPWPGLVLERLIEHPDPKISEPVRAAFLRYTLGYTGKLRYDPLVVCELRRVADRTTIPELEDIFANADDSTSRLHALTALATFDPEHAVDRLLDFLRAGNRYDPVFWTLERFASEKDADRIIDALLETRKTPRDSMTPVEVRFLINRLGPRGRRVVEESLDVLDSCTRMWATWKVKGLSLDAAIDELRAAGIIKMSREAVLEGLRRFRESVGKAAPFDDSDASALDLVLAQAEVLSILFFAETNDLPPNHHELIMWLAKNSGGEFEPECAVQTWHGKNENDLQAPSTVQFLYEGRLYSFGADNRHYSYDVEAVHRALNFALETAGRKGRFIALETGGGDTFVFADPDAFRPIAAKYALPLAGDPDSALREGKTCEPG
jgi:hypothetical protein